MTAWFRRLLRYARRPRLDEELANELQLHIELRRQALVADGMDPREAEYEARRRFGNVVSRREESRELWTFAGVESIVRDARYSLRQLRRTPVFACATMLTLALTIGATTALFAVTNAVVFRALPYRDADRLVAMTMEQEGRDVGSFDEGTAQLAMREAKTFEAVAAYTRQDGNLTGGSQPERIRGAAVSGRFFDVMAVQPAAGRTFTSDELERNGPAAILVSHALWDRVFGRAADIVGRTVRLDDRSYTVVGVMPGGFAFPRRAEYWRPWQPRGTGTGATYYTDVAGRLRADISMDDARNELYALRRAHEGELGRRVMSSTIRIAGLHDHLYGTFRLPLILLLSIVGFVLMIACANIANLLLARMAARDREMVLRAALGAGRGRLVRQLLVESLLLACFGAIPGVAVAVLGLEAFKTFGPASLGTLPGIGIDSRVLLFTAAVAIGTGMLFGIAPAFVAARSNPARWLTTGRSPHGVRSRPRHVLVVLELAAAVMLTIGAGLLAKSFVRYQATERGFDAARVFTASIPLPRARYGEPAARRAFSDQVLQRIRSAPIVASATHSWTMLDQLMMTIPWPARFTPGGRESEQDSFAVAYVGDQYFKTFGIPIVAGAACPPTPDGKVAIVSESWARRAFPGHSAVGEQVGLSGDGRYSVIGVAADVLTLGTKNRALPLVYACSERNDAPMWGTIAIQVVDGIDPMRALPLLREAVSAIDPSQPIADAKTVARIVGDATTTRWFDGALIAAFALLACLLAIFGLYALIAYLVTQRTQEIGIRIALGAAPRDILRLVIRQSAWLCAAGVALGIAGALPLTGLLSAMLFDVDARDASVFILMPALLTIVAFAATMIPAWRALRVDPVVALRAD
jgi:predicted permease